MKLKEIHIKEFKRFSDLTVTGIPDTARLIILAGPNGVGKSSFFDALKTWHWQNGAAAFSFDPTYYIKLPDHSVSGAGQGITHSELVTLSTHDILSTDESSLRKRVYVRSAFRNEADFQITSFSSLQSPLETSRVSRLIDNDTAVSENFQRLVMETIQGVFTDSIPDETTKAELRDRLIGEVATAMKRVLPDLVLKGVGDPLGKGSFYFEKGISKNFPYKNVSAGEKAVFDLLLDLIVKRRYFDNTLWCIDEPESHINTRVQAKLMQELYRHIGDNSQLILATHSIGFMAKARELQKADPGHVVFIDFDQQDFDSTVTLSPAKLDRAFWIRTLDVALGDLGTLVAPERIVLCEGRHVKPGDTSTKGEFDAQCYRKIFADQHPEVDFISVGNSDDVSRDKMELGRSIQAIVTGTTVTRVIDRDYLNDAEVEMHEKGGVRVLSRRNIESFLLDDEILEALCVSVGKPNAIADAIQMKADLLKASVARNNDTDDLKSIAGSCYLELKKLLKLERSGSHWQAFAIDTLSPLMTPEMAVYNELEGCIFGD